MRQSWIWRFLTCAESDAKIALLGKNEKLSNFVGIWSQSSCLGEHKNQIYIILKYAQKLRCHSLEFRIRCLVISGIQHTHIWGVKLLGYQLTLIGKYFNFFRSTSALRLLKPDLPKQIFHIAIHDSSIFVPNIFRQEKEKRRGKSQNYRRLKKRDWKEKKQREKHWKKV